MKQLVKVNSFQDFVQILFKLEMNDGVLCL